MRSMPGSSVERSALSIEACSFRAAITTLRVGAGTQGGCDEPPGLTSERGALDDRDGVRDGDERGATRAGTLEGGR